MVSLRHRGIFFRLLWHIGHSPLRLFEVLQFTLLAWILVQTLVGFGGFLAFGRNMMGVSKALIFLAAVHALIICFRDKRPGIDWELLVPLPFVVYAWFHFQFVSPYGMESGSLLAALVQAYALYFITVNSIHGNRTGKWFVAIVQIVTAVALTGAILQFYLFPEWIVDPERSRNPAYAFGAGGFLQDPRNLGAILVAMLPLSFFLAIKYYRAGPSWLWQCAMATALFVGFWISADRAGWLAMGVVVLALPLMASGEWRARLKMWRNFAVGLGIAGLFAWFATQALHDRMSYYAGDSADELGNLSREVAWSQFAESPLLGNGLGSFVHHWEAHVSKYSESVSTYTVSIYADLLAETGMLGLVLALGPFLLLLASGYRAWQRTPHRKINKEVLGRISNLPDGHPLKKRLLKEKGRIPSQKSILGGLLLGLVGLMIYVGWDTAMRLPFVLFFTAVMVGMLVGQVRQHAFPHQRGKLWILVAIVPLALAVWAASFGNRHYYASYLAYTAGEELNELHGDPDQIFQDPGAVHYIASQFKLSLDLVPSNPTALVGLGNSHLAYLEARLEPSEAVAQRAADPLSKAQSMAPDSWLASFSLGRTMAILGAPEAEVIVLLRRSIELAPNRPEPAALLGSLLLLEDPGSVEGLEFLEHALSLKPDYLPAVNSLRRNRTRSGSSQQTADAPLRLTITPAILAEQFKLVPRGPDRVLGAGLPRPDVQPDPLGES
ncbi:MAG: O-antigen ligase family protein [Puniceicoccaceae bacterium]